MVRRRSKRMSSDDGNVRRVRRRSTRRTRRTRGTRRTRRTRGTRRTRRTRRTRNMRRTRRTRRMRGGASAEAECYSNMSDEVKREMRPYGWGYHFTSPRNPTGVSPDGIRIDRFGGAVPGGTEEKDGIPGALGSPWKYSFAEFVDVINDAKSRGNVINLVTRKEFPDSTHVLDKYGQTSRKEI